MNEKFYTLSPKKQQSIINAGFRVFSQNSYKKSPMSEIAAAAGISKSLLFHYFRNKKELYLFLWDKAVQITIAYLTEYRCYEPQDLFEMMERGMRAKLRIMEIYPDMVAFTIKAFYEKEPEVCGEIQKSYHMAFQVKAYQALNRVDPADFRPGIDIKMMYREMYLASEGYLWEIMQRGETLSAERLERDFSQLLAFWKHIYLKEGD